MVTNRTRALLALLLVCATGLVLSGCIAPGSGASASDPASFPTASIGSPIPDATDDPEPEPTASGAEASISTAGTDAAGSTVSVSGVVTGLVEDGGTCTYRFSDGAAGALTATSQGVANVSTTACGLASLPRSDFSAGAWTVVLEYSSPAAGVVTSYPVSVELS